FLQPPRSCDDYWSEYKHCKSLMNRFHHYYTFGKSPSCKQWKTDYYTCVDWERHQDTAAKDALRQSERARLAQQRQHDPVWKLRKTPPSDWHLPLHHGSPKDS
ncbi:CV039 protein, partial [Amia calva]|nr:CV039 protein [Amia calva]